MKVAKKIRVIGIVQGVGFRPFVQRLAIKFGLKGFVRNIGGSEVEIYLVGEDYLINKFLDSLKVEKPPTAELEEIIVEDAEVVDFKSFEIKKSIPSRKEPSMIPPDVGICDNCIDEILDPTTRWYYYPFNSCAWCGPRFSVMFKVPYDRDNTSMRDFPLCDECKADYGDPSNIRRYHIQGISCSKCGPKIWLVDGKGDLIVEGNRETIIETAKLIDEGYIVAVKGLGGFHIAALATDDEVVLALRKRKKRPQKPFALMAFNLNTVEKHAVLTDLEKEILVSKEKPIVLLRKKDESDLSELVAPGLAHIGFMLPYTGLHYLLLKHVKDKVLIMTSGNPPGKPMCTTNSCAITKLKGIADFYILHNRQIVNRVDDSVLRVSNNRLAFLRRSRGYAPKWLRVPFNADEKVFLGFGADLQTAGAVLFQDRIVPTQYIGDIDEIENVKYLSNAIQFFIDTYGLSGKDITVVADMHPRYQSRRLALEWVEEKGFDFIEVQHHHAHIASVMAEKRLGGKSRVVGIAIDGAGYGLDGQIWGGEVLLADYSSFERVGHLEYHPMPGGDSATLYPVKMLIGILSKFMGKSEVLELLEEKELVSGLKHGYKEAELSYELSKSSNIVKTSSIGRVLDSLSALLGVCTYRSYEGEPAMKLEALAMKYDDKVKPSNFTEYKDGSSIVKTSDIFKEIIFKETSTHPSRDALWTHLSLAHSIGLIASEFALSENIKTVVVSGGAAVNEILLREIEKTVKASGLQLLYPENIPPGDGGIAVGQVSIALHF